MTLLACVAMGIKGGCGSRPSTMSIGLAACLLWRQVFSITLSEIASAWEVGEDL